MRDNFQDQKTITGRTGYELAMDMEYPMNRMDMKYFWMKVKTQRN